MRGGQLLKEDLLDYLDRGIIKLLSRDGRMSFSEMADHLEVTEKTIRTRYKNLIDNDIVKVTGVVNPVSLGVKVVAIIQIGVGPNALDDVCKQLVEFKTVRFVTMTSGEYQLMIQTFHSTYEGLTEFLSKLNRIANISKTNVIMQFDVYKNTFEYI